MAVVVLLPPSPPAPLRLCTAQCCLVFLTSLVDLSASRGERDTRKRGRGKKERRRERENRCFYSSFQVVLFILALWFAQYVVFYQVAA